MEIPMDYGMAYSSLRGDSEQGLKGGRELIDVHPIEVKFVLDYNDRLTAESEDRGRIIGRLKVIAEQFADSCTGDDGVVDMMLLEHSDFVDFVLSVRQALGLPPMKEF